MQHDKNKPHGTDREHTEAAMDRNRDANAGETTGDSANADQQSKPASSHDSTGYPTGNTDGGMRQEQMGGQGQGNQGQMGNQGQGNQGQGNQGQGNQGQMGDQRQGNQGQSQGQPNSQGQGQPSGQQSDTQRQPWGQGQDGGQNAPSERTGQPSGQGQNGGRQEDTRAHTTDTADQGEEKEPAEGVSAEHGNEGSGWQGGGSR